ncbi:hypothetical protein ACXR2T_03755 [Leucobacter sp. HY1910]
MTSDRILGSLVDIASITDFDSKDDEFGIAYLAEHAIVTDAVAPLARQARFKPFTGRAGIIAPIEVLIEPSHNDTTDPGVEFAELSIGSLRIEQLLHSKVFRCDLVRSQCSRVVVEFAFRVFPCNEVEFILNASERCVAYKLRNAHTERRCVICKQLLLGLCEAQSDSRC